MEFPRLADAGTLDEACEVVADGLLAAGFELPSVYLLSGTRLRCRAARGYFQVVDGFGPGTGVIGQVVATGRPVLIPDVRDHPEFIAAQPGLVAEACAPVVSGGEVVGVLSVESTSRLPADTLTTLATAADALGDKVLALGGLPALSPAQRLGRLSVEITAARGTDDIRTRTVAGACELSGMATAALVQRGEGVLEVVAAEGHLAHRVRGWTPDQLEVLASWVRPDTSSHYPGGHVTPPGYEFLRESAVASISVHPTVVAGTVTGYLVLVHDEPKPHAAEVVECLELLAAQAASALRSAAVVAELSVRAERDELTGLGNRSAFKAAVAAAVRAGVEEPQSLGVLLLDLDDFKNVNDSLGHHVGDRLLVEVSRAIQRGLRTDDLPCRLGGDEFAVVLPGAGLATATQVAERILASLAGLAPVEGSHLQTTASIGIVVSDAVTATPSQMLKAADLAMYRAKQQGKGRWEVFEEHLQHTALQRLGMQSDLRAALAAGDQLHLVFQPIVDIANGRMTAVEALARWDHPVMGAVSPAVFIPLAEQTGLIVELGGWVLGEVCRRLSAWTADGADPDLRVAVNVSTRQLDDPTLLAALDACLADGLDPARLVLEITESALAADAERAGAALRAIRERGVHLAVDDFGTGYSSLSRLGSAPVSRLKIDRSFVATITGPDSHVPIVEATMAMAFGLGLGVVAEGVETPEQLAHLRALRCPEVQGYLFSRPLSEEALQPLLRGHRPWAALVEQADADALARPLGLAAIVEMAFRPEVTVEELTGPLLAQACAATGLELAFVNRLDVADDELRVLAATSGSPLIRPGAAISWSRSICHTLLSDGRARLPDSQAHPDVAALGRAVGIRAFLSEPVWGPGGELWGTLCATSAQARSLSDGDSAAMRLLAGLITEKIRSSARSSSAGEESDTRLIIIDDDAVTRLLVEATVTSAPGARVVGMAANGEDGISLATAQQPDVVVLDFDLPDLSAAVIVERIRHSSRRSRIVLYSARDDIHAIGQRLGADRAVCKGDGIERLHEALTVL